MFKTEDLIDNEMNASGSEMSDKGRRKSNLLNLQPTLKIEYLNNNKEDFNCDIKNFSMDDTQ